MLFFLTSVTLIIGGTYIYVYLGFSRFIDSLSPEAQDAYYTNWTEEGLPAPYLVDEISIAEETMLNPIYENELTVALLLTVITFCLVVVIAPVVARRLTQPLEQAAASAQEIADGNFDHRIELSSHRSAEVSSLNESFTAMAASLQKKMLK